MYIKHLFVENFKSFDTLEIEFNKLNILIGANASGKSNFIRIFEFLRNIANHGLSNAISMEGGIEYIRNTKLCAEKDLTIGIRYDPEYKFVQTDRKGKTFVGIKIKEVNYKFSLRFHKRGKGFLVAHDRLILAYEFVSLERQIDDFEEQEFLGTGEVHIFVEKGKIGAKANLPESLSITRDDIIPYFWKENVELPAKKVLLLETPFFSFAHQFHSPIEDIPIYDFDPKTPKKAVSITGKTELEENGSNLSIVLNHLVEDKEKKRKFLNLLSDVLPFIKDLYVQRFADKSLLFTLKEDYYEQTPPLPASFISDGTVSVTSLIIALYFEDKPMIILEEPERNIHPHLISKIMNMLREVSEIKQIFVSTHNPEIVKYADAKDLLLVSRGPAGFSMITKPGRADEIQIFLQNEIGMDELFVQDLLGVQ